MNRFIVFWKVLNITSRMSSNVSVITVIGTNSKQKNSRGKIILEVLDCNEILSYRLNVLECVINLNNMGIDFINSNTPEIGSSHY